MNKIARIISFLPLLGVIVPTITPSYFILENPKDKEKSYLYSPPPIKNHFLKKYDIISIQKLILKLKKPISPIDTLISTSLDDDTKKLINTYNPEDKKALKNLEIVLIKDLNRIIKEKSIYSNKQIINSIKPSDTLLKLLENSEDKTMLNRLILNEAYPDEIKGWEVTFEGKDNKAQWIRNIKKGELPYKYFKAENKESPIRKTSEISFSFTKNNTNDKWDIPIIVNIYKRPTGLFYKHYSAKINNENKEITLKASGQKIARRLYLNLSIKTKEDDQSSSIINGNIHLIIKNDGTIEKDLFVAFTKKTKADTKEYIRIKGKIEGNIEKAQVKGKLIDVDGKELGYFEGNISLFELFFI